MNRRLRAQISNKTPVFIGGLNEETGCTLEESSDAGTFYDSSLCLSLHGLLVCSRLGTRRRLDDHWALYVRLDLRVLYKRRDRPMKLIFMMIGVGIILAFFLPVSREFENDHDFTEFKDESWDDLKEER